MFFLGLHTFCSSCLHNITETRIDECPLGCHISSTRLDEIPTNTYILDFIDYLNSLVPQVLLRTNLVDAETQTDNISRSPSRLSIDSSNYYLNQEDINCDYDCESDCEEFFAKHDSDNDGLIDCNELFQMLSQVYIISDKKTAQILFEKFDEHHENKLNLDKCKAIFKYISDEETRFFDLGQADKESNISKTNLVKLLRVNMSDPDVSEIINRNEQVTFDMYVQIKIQFNQETIN